MERHNIEFGTPIDTQAILAKTICGMGASAKAENWKNGTGNLDSRLNT